MKLCCLMVLFLGLGLPSLCADEPKIQRGNGQTKLHLGSDHIIPGIEEDARKGDLGSQILVSQMYFNGHGVGEDFVKGVFWARMAANQGSAHGAYLLGVSYQNGYGVEPDNNLALAWLTNAATAASAKNEKVLIPAQKHLATWHWRNRNYCSSIKWSSRALVSQYKDRVARALDQVVSAGHILPNPQEFH